MPSFPFLLEAGPHLVVLLDYSWHSAWAHIHRDSQGNMWCQGWRPRLSHAIQVTQPFEPFLWAWWWVSKPHFMFISEGASTAQGLGVPIVLNSEPRVLQLSGVSLATKIVFIELLLLLWQLLLCGTSEIWEMVLLGVDLLPWPGSVRGEENRWRGHEIGTVGRTLF